MDGNGTRKELYDEVLNFRNQENVVGLVFVFFFQAEDGIRDDLVTGVQTCALPICQRKTPKLRSPTLLRRQACRWRTSKCTACSWAADSDGAEERRTSCARAWRLRRSEERRVGKECRSRWAAYDGKKK